MSQNVQSAEAPDKNSAWKEIVEIVKTIVYALLIALVLRIVFFQPFTIPSASMEPNLYEGGDIVVFKLPSDGHTDYVKRVIGLPGDRVQMKLGLLYVNDVLVERQELSPVKDELPGGVIRDVARFQERLDTGKTFVTQDFGPDFT